MITLETEFRGFDARSWHRLVTLVAPGLASRAPYEVGVRAGEPGGTLFVLFEGDRVLRALHSHRGVVEVTAWPGPDALESLAQEQGAQFVLAAGAGTLEELLERLGARVRTDDDLVTGSLVGLSAVREMLENGELLLWPPLLPQRVPLPTASVLARAVDFIAPDERALLVALFVDDAVETSLLVRRRGGSIDRVLGPEALREMTGPLGGDFRRDHRVIRAAVEREIGPLAIGLYAETATVHALLRKPQGGAWAEAIALRDVVFDPMPAWIAVAAGAGAVRAAASRSKGLMAGLGVLGAISPTFRRIKQAADAVVGFDATSTFGFNPLHVLAQILGTQFAVGLEADRRAGGLKHRDEVSRASCSRI